MPLLSKARIAEYLKPFLKPFERLDAEDLSFRASMEGVILSSIDALNNRPSGGGSPEEILDDETSSEITTYSSAKIEELISSIPTSSLIDLDGGSPSSTYDYPEEFDGGTLS